MTSASLELKKFKELYTRLCNDIFTITGIEPDPELTAALAFPMVRGIFTTDRGFCARAANGHVTIDDLKRLPEGLLSHARELEEWQLGHLVPIVQKVAAIFYAHMETPRG